MSLWRACGHIFSVILNPPWRMKRQDPKRWNLHTKVHYVISQETDILHWHLLLLDNFSFLTDLFSTIETKRCTSFYEGTSNAFAINCMNNYISHYALLPSNSRFSGFFWAPCVCGVLCYGYRIWRKPRKCTWDLVIGVSPWNAGDYRLCKYFHFKFIWNEKEDKVYSR
jgi:hypothetical protein